MSKTLGKKHIKKKHLTHRVKHLSKVDLEGNSTVGSMGGGDHFGVMCNTVKDEPFFGENGSKLIREDGRLYERTFVMILKMALMRLIDENLFTLEPPFL